MPRGLGWHWQQNNERGYQWQPASLDHLDGQLSWGAMAGEGRSIGHTFTSPNSEANAFASRCPHCGSNWARRKIDSPIRDLGSGFQRIMQLLTDALMRELDQSVRKFVLFSDSRQDAAKLSTGIKKSHYLDVVRQIAFSHLHQRISNAASEYAQELENYDQTVQLFELQQMVVAEWSK